MANASNFIIGANDEHGLNPPTAGKRTPILPYINRSFYENEFNREAKLKFIEADLRCGYNTFDVKPEIQDISISTRVRRINNANLTAVVTFAYNAAGDGTTFNNAQGIEVYYSTLNPKSSLSRTLSTNIYNTLIANTGRNGRGVGTLNVGVLSNVNCASSLIEAGFMTNFIEAKLMLDPDYVTNVAESACIGLCETLDVQYIPRDNLNNYPTIRLQSRGNFVKLLQYLLNQYGFNLSTDGLFGNNTLSAVRTFQGNNGLSVDGIVGPRTWNALLNLTPTATTIRRGSRSSNVLYLQQKLLSKLYNITNLDGIFGPETERAVIEFQKENGLTPDGIVGPKTWAEIIKIGGGRNL